MSYQEHAQQQAAQTNATEQAAFTALFTEWPDLQNVANTKMILEFVHKAGAPVTEGSLKAAVDHLVATGRISVKSQAQVERDRIADAERAQQDAQAERERLLGGIRTRLLQSIPAHASSEAVQGHKVSVERQLTNTFSFKSNEELANDLFQMDEKKRLRELSPADLRKLVKTGNAQVPTLPGEYTSEVLNNLLKTNIAEIKRLIRFYGSDQIDARRGYKAPSQPGVAIRG
jgi:hypothetical protein